MKQTNFRSVLILTGAALVAGFSGCATKPDTQHDAWIEPRPLGRELATYRPPLNAADKPMPVPVEEPEGALTLRQALALALTRNPDLAAFSWAVRIGEARTLQAGLRPNPEAGVEVEDVLGTGSFIGFREAQTTIQLSQLVELGGKRAARVKAASLARELAAWDYEARRLEVFTQTAAAFVEVLSLQHRLALAEETAQLAEQTVAAVKQRVAAARTFAVEETKAQVALASVRIERDQTQRALAAARARLAAAWGSTQPRFTHVEGNLETQAAVPDLESLQARLMQNPDLARWTTEIAEREAQLKLERSRRVPDVTVGGGYRRLSGPEDNAFVAGVSIPLPLFNKNEGNIKEAEFQVAKARDEQRAAELRVAAALSQAWQRLAAAAAEVAALKEQVLPGAQQTFDTVRQYYTEGRLSYLDVLDAQRTLFAARAQHYRALADYQQALVTVESLIGEPATAQDKTP
ncbi:MAG: TolC family protein [Limisphaerales bacterium]